MASFQFGKPTRARRRRRQRRTVVAVATTALATVAFSVTGVAHADLWGPQGYHGDYPDAFWDESTSDVLREGSRSNLVGFWQAYLVSYNLLGQCSDLDGIFGPKTRDATIQMQSFLGVAPTDGVVGPNTWDRAARWITFAGYSFDPQIGAQTVWQPRASSATTANYYQNMGGIYIGYWYWGHPWASGFGVHNTSSSTLDFRSACA